jgi:Rieske 2Fe-2S family protein
MALAPGFETVSESGRLSGRPFVAADEDRGRVSDAFVFPLWMTSLQPDYLLTYRLAPLAVDRTLVVAEIHVHQGAQAGGADLDDLFTFWDRTNAEDRTICELQQRGLSSRHAPPSCYAASEDGLHAFERIVAARYLRAMNERST